MKDPFDGYNATTLFLVPLLGYKLKELARLGFESAFIKDELREIEYPNALYLLFRPVGVDNFNEFVEKEREKGTILDEYDYDGGWTMLVWKYSSRWNKDVELILQGKYSQTSDEYQYEIPSTVPSISLQSDVMTIQHHIFNKTEWVKEYIYNKYGLEVTNQDECWSFYPDREIFSEKTLNKLI